MFAAGSFNSAAPPALIYTPNVLDWVPAIVLIALHVVVGQAEPVKRAFARKRPEGICEWRMQYLPLLQLPWCGKA